VGQAVILVELAILVHFRPYEDPAKNRSAIANECVLMLLMYMFMCFSDFVTDEEAEFTIGFLLIFTVVSHVAIGLLKVLKATFSRVAMHCKRRKMHKR
jgi:hypothetical protein